MKKILGSVAILALAAPLAAQAADLPRAPAYKAPVVAPVISGWTGFYIGLNAGGIGLNGDTISGTPGPCSAVLTGCTSIPNYSTLMASAINAIGGGSRSTSFLGGGQIGYNWQAANWVFGIEADLDGIASGTSGNSRTGTIVTPSPAFPAFPLTSTFADSQKLDYLGTVRGRLGATVTPTFLLYGTGGLAYGQLSSSTTITQAIAAPDPSTPAFAIGGGRTNLWGWAVGAGAEWMFAPHWSFKAEGLYYDLGTVSYAMPLQIVSTAVPGAVTGSATANVSERVNGWIARVGVNLHFDSGSVVARY